MLPTDLTGCAAIDLDPVGIGRDELDVLGRAESVAVTLTVSPWL